MKLTVDRIEEGIAVVENEDMAHVEIPADVLPDGAKEGSILIYDGETYALESDEEAERKSMLMKKQQMLFKKSKKD